MSSDPTMIQSDLAPASGAHPTRPPAGIPEVLSFRLPGRASPAEVRAVLVGSRINTRELDGYTDPQELDATQSGVAFVFRYGAVVLFGASEDEEQAFI